MQRDVAEVVVIEEPVSTSAGRRQSLREQHAEQAGVKLMTGARFFGRHVEPPQPGRYLPDLGGDSRNAIPVDGRPARTLPDGRLSCRPHSMYPSAARRSAMSSASSSL